MRQSNLFAPTLREVPAEAEVISHQLMLRAGYIRQLAAGVYTYLPLGVRVLRKVEQIVREEMDRAGAQEILMPSLQPAELWKESGRYEEYGAELIRLHDRHDREFALGPTHEEVITSLVRNEISTYRRLPVTLYQIQTKFRDERRPRFGLLRGREFIMKDAYSFNTDWDSLNQSYWGMHEAYTKIFNRLELNFRSVEADAGVIGGEGDTHEFMALANIGEDIIATCTCCSYAANLEKAESGPRTISSTDTAVNDVEKFHTPNIRTINELMLSLQIEAHHIFKTLIYLVDGNAIAVLIRGDHEVNEVKLKHYLHAQQVKLADSATAEQVTGAPTGFAGPMGLAIPLLVDQAIVNTPHGIAGANEEDYHVRYVRPGSDFPLEHVGDFRNVTEADPCPRCDNGVLDFYRGIEVGHVFKLGTKYSEKLGAVYLDSTGKEQVMVMGCYGIGVSRLLSAIAEQNHDEHGLIWPSSLAPFHVHVIPVSVKDTQQMKIAEEIYQHLLRKGIEVLFDDRDERPGVKFKDSDLMGIPIRIVIGKHATQGNIEFKERINSESIIMKIEDSLLRTLELVNIN